MINPRKIKVASLTMSAASGAVFVFWAILRLRPPASDDAYTSTNVFVQLAQAAKDPRVVWALLAGIVIIAIINLCKSLFNSSGTVVKTIIEKILKKDALPAAWIELARLLGFTVICAATALVAAGMIIGYIKFKHGLDSARELARITETGKIVHDKANSLVLRSRHLSEKRTGTQPYSYGKQEWRDQASQLIEEIKSFADANDEFLTIDDKVRVWVHCGQQLLLTHRYDETGDVLANLRLFTPARLMMGVDLLSRALEVALNPGLPTPSRGEEWDEPRQIDTLIDAGKPNEAIERGKAYVLLHNVPSASSAPHLRLRIASVSALIARAANRTLPPRDDLVQDHASKALEIVKEAMDSPEMAIETRFSLRQTASQAHRELADLSRRQKQPQAYSNALEASINELEQVVRLGRDGLAIALMATLKELEGAYRDQKDFASFQRTVQRRNDICRLLVRRGFVQWQASVDETSSILEELTQ